MKTQKLFIIAAISCLLLGALGGAAMAELNGCGDGLLYNEEITGNLRITGDEPCLIIGSTISGNIRVINLDNVLLMNNVVYGLIRVDGNAGNGTANVIANTVLGGKLIVRDMEIANVIENETLTDNIRVVKNVNALVQKNISAQDLICRGNTDLDSFINFAGQKLDCE
jgi:hypothetical protein